MADMLVSWRTGELEPEYNIITGEYTPVWCITAERL